LFFFIEVEKEERRHTTQAVSFLLFRIIVVNIILLSRWFVCFSS